MNNNIAIIIFVISLVYFTTIEVNSFLETEPKNTYSSVLSSFINIMLKLYVMLIVMYIVFFKLIGLFLYFVFGLSFNKDYIKTIIEPKPSSDLYKYILFNFIFMFTTLLVVSILLISMKSFCKVDEEDKESLIVNYKLTLYSIIAITTIIYCFSVFLNSNM